MIIDKKYFAWLNYQHLIDPSIQLCQNILHLYGIRGFSQNFWCGGTCFRGRFSVPFGDEATELDGGLTSVIESDEGGLGKIVR